MQLGASLHAGNLLDEVEPPKFRQLLQSLPLPEHTLEVRWDESGVG